MEAKKKKRSFLDRLLCRPVEVEEVKEKPKQQPEDPYKAEFRKAINEYKKQTMKEIEEMMKKPKTQENEYVNQFIEKLREEAYK